LILAKLKEAIPHHHGEGATLLHCFGYG
jgi:hypothetical protein